MAAVDRMQHCDELTIVTRRIFDAMREADLDAWSNLVSEDPCVVIIGTDFEEWWVGHREAIEVVRRQFEEFGGFELRIDGGVQAWREGPLGWSVSRATIPAPSGDTQHTRTTCVFLFNAGLWRCVHLHMSFGVSNVEMLGMELTTSLESLAAFAESVRPDLSTSTSTDGTVTIVFTDIEASTEAAERLGDRRWLELLHWHDEILESEARRCGGTVVKSQGDGFMLAFSSATHALDFSAAVQLRTSVGYGDQPVRVRIGLNTGDAIQDRDDFYGHAVIVAARVAAHALGGEVLATDLVAGLVAGVDRFRFGVARPTELKGLSGTYVVRPLLVSA
jgi:class 3 adenylate cyclase